MLISSLFVRLDKQELKREPLISKMKGGLLLW